MEPFAWNRIARCGNCCNSSQPTARDSPAGAQLFRRGRAVEHQEIETLRQRRSAHAISYITVTEDGLEPFAPVIERLAQQ